jgi:hypothetical protein
VYDRLISMWGLNCGLAYGAPAELLVVMAPLAGAVQVCARRSCGRLVRHGFLDVCLSSQLMAARRVKQATYMPTEIGDSSQSLAAALTTLLVILLCIVGWGAVLCCAVRCGAVRCAGGVTSVRQPGVLYGTRNHASVLSRARCEDAQTMRIVRTAASGTVCVHIAAATNALE